MSPTAAKAAWPVYAWQADQEAATMTAPRPSSTQPSAPTAIATSNVDVGLSRSVPRYSIQSVTDAYEVFGVDAIWHIQYLGPKADWFGYRRCYDCDIDTLVLKVAEHVRQGLYSVISLNATKHALVVICGCMKMQKDMPDNIFHEPRDEGEAI